MEGRYRQVAMMVRLSEIKTGLRNPVGMVGNNHRRRHEFGRDGLGGGCGDSLIMALVSKIKIN